MAKAYLNREDVRMRLNRCIVTWDGEPFYCDVDTQLDNWFDVTLLNFEGVKGKPPIVDHRDERFSGASLPIGYFNYREGAYYATREPSRRQNQGLNTLNVVTSPKCGNAFLTSNGFYKMLKDEYPKADEAIRKLRDRDVSGMAISRWFAYCWMDGHRIGVYFQDRLVGYLDNKDKIVLLPDKAVSFVMKQARRVGVIDG